MDPVCKAIMLAGKPSFLARRYGVSTQAACFWRDGLRPFPVEHMADLEKLIGGAVKRQEMRPNDFEKIWPELATQAAPAAQEG